MDPNRDRVEDFMQRYGYAEKEAEAAIYLREAWDRLTELYRAEDEAEGVPSLSTTLFLQSNVDPHFHVLGGLLAKRVLARHYPEGWGSRSAPEQEWVSEAPDPADPIERQRPGESPEDPGLD